jgi:PAS domain S-box-containing protein
MKPRGVRLTGRPPTLLLCQIFVLLWGLGNGAFAAKRVLNVGIYDNPPKVYVDQNGRPAGIFVDLLDHIAAIEEWQINYHFYTWQACLEHLETGKIDLLPDVAHSPERKARFEFNAIEVLESWSQVYIKDNLSVQQLSDLSGKRVAVLNGSVQQSSFRRTMTGFGYTYTEVPASSFTEAMSMVSIDLADAAITNVYFGDLNASEYELQKSTLIFNPVNLYYAIGPSGDSSVIQTIDLYLKVWKNTPKSFYYTTLQQYTASAPQHGTNPLIIVLIGLLLAALVTFLILLHLKLKQIEKLRQQLKTHQRLLDNESNKFRSYFEFSPIGMFVADAGGRYTDMNPAACHLTGYQAQELKRMTIADLIPESGRKAAGNHFNQLKTEGRAEGSMPYKTKSGEIRHWRVSAVKIEENQLIGFVEDITDQILMEQDRRNLPDKLEQQVKEKTHELNQRISELEHFREVTIQRELRMEELRAEIKRLKNKQGPS